MRGIISRGEDLCQYENLWHYDIITDTKLGLKESVSGYVCVNAACQHFLLFVHEWAVCVAELILLAF